MYKLKLNINNFSGSTALIPISLESKPVDNTDIINRVFVDNAVEESINDIVDYEKCLYNPVLTNEQKARTITFNLFDKNGDRITYGSSGFENEDIVFRRKNFTESFLRIEFYDDKNPLINRLIDVITINSRLHQDDLNQNGTPKQANSINVRFTITKPSLNYNGFSDNFYIYNRKNIKIGDQKKIYAKFEFLNAKTGKAKKFISEASTLSINQLIEKLYFEYNLIRKSDGYYYNITNQIESDYNISLNLYEVSVS